jgi:hypothetical protein
MLVETSDQQYPLARTRCRLEDAKFVDWIHLTQDMVQWQDFVNTLMYLRGSIESSRFWGAIRS